MNWNGFQNYNKFVRDLNESAKKETGGYDVKILYERMYINQIIDRLGLDPKKEIRNAKVKIENG